MALVIKPSDFYRLFSPSRCELRLYLSHKGVDPAPLSPFEEVFIRLGQEHEMSHLATFPEVSDLTGRPAEKTIEEIRKGSPVIYQGGLRALAFVDGQELEVVGIPDLLIRFCCGKLFFD